MTPLSSFATVCHKSRQPIYYASGITKLIRELGPHILFKRRRSAAESDSYIMHLGSRRSNIGAPLAPRIGTDTCTTLLESFSDCVIECASINAWDQETLSPVKEEVAGTSWRSREGRGGNAPRRKCGNRVVKKVGRRKEGSRRERFAFCSLRAYTWSNLGSVTAVAVTLTGQKKVKYRKQKSALF